MFSFDVGKYKGIIVSVALFLLLDASVLILNFYISYEIADDAVGVNIAGRQRMLSQRTMKSLFDIQSSISEPKEMERALSELSLTTTLFNNTLSAFNTGGQTQSATGELFYLQAATSPKAKQAIKDALEIWEPYWSKVRMMQQASPTDSPVMFEQALNASINYGKENNLALLKLMNNLTVELEAIASSKATTLRLIQTVGISLAILNFFIIMFHFLSQLKESDKKIESARSETEEILNTVNEGLFLLDQDLIISSQYSITTETIFDRKDIGGISLESLLENIISEKDMNTTKGFIKLLFKPEIKANLIGDLNPLDNVEVNIITESEGLKNKYLSFNFSRAHSPDSGTISHILVTVSDITEQVLLTRKLETIKAQNDQQMEVLTKIIHTNSDLLASYINNNFKTFNQINEELKKPAKSKQQLFEKANMISSLIHNFKGESSAMEMDNFVNLAHNFEDSLQDIRTKESITGNDFLALTVQLNQLISQTENIYELSKKLTYVTKESSDTPVLNTTKRNWEQLHTLTKNISKEQDKQVKLVTSGLNDEDINDDLYNTINSIILQLIRNAVSHGIEPFNERVDSEKPDTGKIDIRLIHHAKDKLELIFQDDGAGINVEKVREQAIRQNIISEHEAELMDSKKIIALIFEPGFSTSSNIDENSGRGVGMLSIRNLVKQWAGKILITNRQGLGTTFNITLQGHTGSIKEAA